MADPNPKELTKRKTLEELIAEDARSPIPTLQVQPDGSPSPAPPPNLLNPTKSIQNSLIQRRI